MRGGHRFSEQVPRTVWGTDQAQDYGQTLGTVRLFWGHLEQPAEHVSTRVPQERSRCPWTRQGETCCSCTAGCLQGGGGSC